MSRLKTPPSAAHHPPSGIIKSVEADEETVTDPAGNPGARVVSLVPRANRTAIGSLAGQVDLTGDWDSQATNAEIAAGFDLGD